MDAKTFADGARVIEDRVVSLVSKGNGELAVSAWDVETGEPVWEHAASTGSVGPERTWPLTVIEGPDGSPLIANLAPPIGVNVEIGTQVIPGFGESTISRDIPMHLVQFVDVQTGDIVAETERANMYVWNTCGFVNAICARTLNVEKSIKDEEDSWDEKLIQSDGKIEPLLPEGYRSGFSTADQIFVVDKADGSTAVIRYDGNEVKWEVGLAEFGLGETPTGQLAFGAERISEGDSSLLKVTLTDKKENSTGLAEYTTNPVFLMLDWATGDVLWSEDELSGSGANGLFEPGSMHYVKGLSGDYEPERKAVTTLESRDLLTGEPEWEVELAGLQTSIDKLGKTMHTGDEDTGIFYTDDGWTLTDLTTGEPIEIKDDHMFGCVSRGSAVRLPQPSNPESPLVDFTSNYYSAGCLGSGTRVAEPSELSKAAVSALARTWSPYSDAPTDPQERFEAERVRVIANETGIHAYRF